MNRFATFCIVAACIGSAATAASSATIVYTNEATFLAQLTTTGLVDFDSLPFPGQGISSPQNGAGGGFAFSVDAFNGLYSAGDVSSDVWLTTNVGDSPLVFTFTAGNPNAVGGNFFVTDISGNSVASSPATVLVEVNDGTSFNVPINSTPTSNFVGFISDTAISSLTVTRLANTGGDEFWPTINDLIVGVGTVPEPATLSLLVLAGSMLFARRRG